MAYGKSLVNSTVTNVDNKTDLFCPVVFDGYLNKNNLEWISFLSDWFFQIYVLGPQLIKHNRNEKLS